MTRAHYCLSYEVSVKLHVHVLSFLFVHVGSTEVIVYSAQGVNDPVTSAMHIIFGIYFIILNFYTSCRCIYNCSHKVLSLSQNMACLIHTL